MNQTLDDQAPALIPVGQEIVVPTRECFPLFIGADDTGIRIEVTALGMEEAYLKLRLPICRGKRGPVPVELVSVGTFKDVHRQLPLRGSGKNLPFLFPDGMVLGIFSSLVLRVGKRLGGVELTKLNISSDQSVFMFLIPNPEAATAAKTSRKAAVVA